MKFRDLIHETTAALLSNKVRSGLTVLGIVIGIASVIAMMAIGAGASNSIQSSIQSLGSNLVLIQPGAPRGVGQQVSAGRGNAQTLNDADVTALSQGLTTLALAVAPDLTTRQQVIVGGNNTNTQVVGTVPSYSDVRSITISEGTFFSNEQNLGLSKVAVIGPTTRDDLFGVGAESVGQTIRIKGLEFTVIGVTATKGGTGFNNQDDRIFIPLSVAQRYLVGAGANGFYVSSISIQAVDQNSMTDLQTAATNILLERHHIADPNSADFSTLNQSDIVSAASSVTQTLTLFLVFVAGISLVVGGIGIMNMMLTTV
ncbi:MAG: ABC transporter permease, partial [Candidatus Vogelbacteria bacterium]|nr:ABC transporter permease [Candidatus Vogelbacteria bacterium]